MKQTECQRIIEEGILPASFFEEETICDFLVTTERKKIWAILLDILIRLDEICRGNNLHYMLAGGSLLGKIRHNGFIPWDDDIDVFMPREDYEKFIVLARKELHSPYFLQVPGQDNDYFFSHTKIRNSNSTCISLAFRYCEFHQGIALDVFPLDNCLLEKAEENWNKINELVLTNSTNMRRSLLYPSDRDLERMKMYPQRDGNEVFKEIEEIATQYNNIETEYAIAATTTPYPADRLIFKWKDVLDTVDVDYYGYSIKIPRNYDAILKTAFGNYMELPPKESRGVWHAFSFFDPDTDYKTTLQLLREKDKNSK